VGSVPHAGQHVRDRVSHGHGLGDLYLSRCGSRSHPFRVHRDSLATNALPSPIAWGARYQDVSAAAMGRVPTTKWMFSYWLLLTVGADLRTSCVPWAHFSRNKPQQA